MVFVFAGVACAERFMWIAGCDYDTPYDLSENCSGTGWSWNRGNSKLSLNSSYTGEHIFIVSYWEFTAVTLEITGDVTVRGGDFGIPLRCCDASMEITGSGKLTLVPSLRGREYSFPTLSVTDSIMFSGAEVIVSADGELNSAILAETGGVFVTGSAKVTASAQGTNGYAVYSAENIELYQNASLQALGEGAGATGLLIKDGMLDVEDNASLTAKGNGEGYAVEIREGDMFVYNDNVTLFADNEAHSANRDNSGEGNIDVQTTQDTQMPYSTAYNGLDPSFSNNGMLGTADKIKIIAPKLANGQLKAGSASDQTFSFTVQGSMPEVNVYVAAKDARKLWPDTYFGTEDVLLTRSNIAKYKIPFRVTDCYISSEDIAGSNNTLTLAFNGANVSLKNFPITVSANNDNPKMKKPATKILKLNVNETAAPEWDYPSAKSEILVPIGTESSGGIPSSIYCVNSSTPGPYSVSVKGSGKNGVNAIVKQPLFDYLGNVTEPGSVRIYGTLDKVNKESKTSLTLIATNTSTKKKASLKVTVASKLAPYFEDKLLNSDKTRLAKAKTAEKGKVPSVKASAKGSKPITYSVSSQDAEALAKVGLRINTTKGSIEAITKGQTKITQENGEFASLDIAIIATNSVGSASVRAYVGVTGTKPKFSSKTIEVSAGSVKAGDVVGTLQVKGITASTSSADAYVRYTLTKGTLPGGLAFRNYDELAGGEAYRNMYALVVTDSSALASAAQQSANRKGVSVTVRASNYGTESDGKIKIKLASGITASESNSTSYANVRENSVAQSLTPEKSEIEPVDEQTTDGITFGADRTAQSLTAGEMAAISDAGYVIAAVLPEIRAEESGQFDIENVKLYDDIPEGAKLIWFAFPDRVTTDEDIAEFYDDTGAEIEVVPASREVSVSAWLNDGIIYRPVIAVEAVSE